MQLVICNGQTLAIATDASFSALSLADHEKAIARRGFLEKGMQMEESTVRQLLAAAQIGSQWSEPLPPRRSSSNAAGAAYDKDLSGHLPHSPPLSHGLLSH